MSRDAHARQAGRVAPAPTGHQRYTPAEIVHLTPIRLAPDRIARVLIACSLTLSVAGLLTQTVKYVLGHDHLFGLVRLFALDRENNLPSWFSSSLLLFCAVLLALIATRTRGERDRWRRHWTLLAVLFLYLSIDEAASIHELLGAQLDSVLDTGGPFYSHFAWALPALFLVPLLGLGFARFVLALPPSTARLFVAAALLYVGGALGVEIVGGAYSQAHGLHNLGYAAIATVEEGLEMLGLAVFGYALLQFVAARWGDWRVSLRADCRTAPR